MSSLSQHHQELDDQGIGKCSVPMWCMGCDAGFCDKTAYGNRPPSEVYYIHYPSGREEIRKDGRYAGYVPGLACPAHGGPSSRVFQDGSSWCAVLPDFIDLAVSPAGFGDTPEAARAELHKLTRKGL